MNFDRVRVCVCGVCVCVWGGGGGGGRCACGCVFPSSRIFDIFHLVGPLPPLPILLLFRLPTPSSLLLLPPTPPLSLSLSPFFSLSSSPSSLPLLLCLIWTSPPLLTSSSLSSSVFSLPTSPLLYVLLLFVSSPSFLPSFLLWSSFSFSRWPCAVDRTWKLNYYVTLLLCPALCCTSCHLRMRFSFRRRLRTCGQNRSIVCLVTKSLRSPLFRLGTVALDLWSSSCRLAVRCRRPPSSLFQSSGAVWKSMWPSWAPRPNRPSVDVKQ